MTSKEIEKYVKLNKVGMHQDCQIYEHDMRM